MNRILIQLIIGCLLIILGLIFMSNFLIIIGICFGFYLPFIIGVSLLDGCWTDFLDYIIEIFQQWDKK